MRKRAASRRHGTAGSAPRIELLEDRRLLSGTKLSDLVPQEPPEQEKPSPAIYIYRQQMVTENGSLKDESRWMVEERSQNLDNSSPETLKNENDSPASPAPDDEQLPSGYEDWVKDSAPAVDLAAPEPVDAPADVGEDLSASEDIPLGMEPDVISAPEPILTPTPQADLPPRTEVDLIPTPEVHLPPPVVSAEPAGLGEADAGRPSQEPPVLPNDQAQAASEESAARLPLAGSDQAPADPGPGTDLPVREQPVLARGLQAVAGVVQGREQPASADVSEPTPPASTGRLGPDTLPEHVRAVASFTDTTPGTHDARADLNGGALPAGPAEVSPSSGDIVFAAAAAEGRQEAPADPILAAPQEADLLGEGQPFDQATLDAALQQFLHEANELGESADPTLAGMETSAYLAALVVGAACWEVGRRTRRRRQPALGLAAEGSASSLTWLPGSPHSSTW